MKTKTFAERKISRIIPVLYALTREEKRLNDRLAKVKKQLEMYQVGAANMSDLMASDEKSRTITGYGTKQRDFSSL